MKHSTKNITLILVAILVVGGAFIFAEYKNRKEKIVYVAPQVANAVAINSPNIDTDDDGIKDWEEILLGTDPNKADNKKIQHPSSPPVKDITKQPEKADPIDSVSKEFFARYMELRQLGLSNDKLNQDDLVQKTVGNINLKTPAVYKKEEILVKTDDSIEAVKQYGIDVGNIFKKYAINSRNEAVIAKESLQTESPELLKEIDPIILSYRNIINTLIKVRVPQSMAIIHLDLVNAINGNIFVAQSFRNSGVDPLLGLQAIAYYQVAAKKLFDSVNAVRSYFSYLGINDKTF